MRHIYQWSLLFILLTSPAWAGLYFFSSITENNPANAVIGQSQIWVDVTNGGDQVTFTFGNDGPQPSVIANIYFEDGILLAYASLDDSLPGVDFEDVIGSAAPPSLPGGGALTPQFEPTSVFSAQASNPQSVYDVGPGEWVAIVFDLQPDKTAWDVEEALQNGQLRIGLHVISMGDDEGSESFVNNPEPTTMMLLGLGALLTRSQCISAKRYKMVLA